jgi:hypothetical protein
MHSETKLMTHTCKCTSDSYPLHCPVFGKDMNRELHTICQGKTLTVNGKPFDYEQNVYLESWAHTAPAGVPGRKRFVYTGEKEVDRIRYACEHLGDKVTGETLCSCGGGRKPTPTAPCSLKGQCSPLAQSQDRKLQGCRTCDDWTPRDEPTLKEEIFADWQPADAPKKPLFDLTIGISIPPNEEYSAIWASLNSIFAHHAEALVGLKVEVLVIDGNPGDKSSEAVKAWVERKIKPVATGKYVAYSGPGGTAQPRNAIFEHASGEVVVTFDPHVLLETGALKSVVDYFKARPKSLDLLVGPLVDDSGSVSTHQRLEWGAGALGVWTGDKTVNPDSPPKPVDQQGLGCFAMRREAWPGFHSDFREFGGCETYLCEKVRLKGGEVKLVPKFRWRHRFQRPWGVTYAASTRQRLKNYLTGFLELGRTDWILSCLDHYRTWKCRKTGRRHLSDSQIEEVIQEVIGTYGASVLPSHPNAKALALLSSADRN